MRTRNSSKLKPARCLALAAGSLFAVHAATAQCDPAWRAVGGPAGGDTTVWASTMWDPDGSGPQQPKLVIAGEFLSFNGTPVNNIVVWDGSSWSTLGDGLGGAGSWVTSLGALPNGDLVAGGAVSGRVARFNGTVWTPLGSGFDSEVHALAVLPNGDLVAGGDFQVAYDVGVVNYIARWDGSAWQPLATGTDESVRALTVLQNGHVVAGGDFNIAGSAACSRIAR